MRARLPAGYGGGPQNQKDLMRQAQKMQEQFAATQAELEAREFKVTSGGGMVEVTMNGKKEITALAIKPEIVDPDDIEMLQDLIVAATNEALRKMEEESQAAMSKLTGGLGGLGGGFPF